MFHPDPSQLSLELSKFNSNLTTKWLNRFISTARKIHNCWLFVKCVSDKKEYQKSVLNALSPSHPSDLPIVKCYVAALYKVITVFALHLVILVARVAPYD